MSDDAELAVGLAGEGGDVGSELEGFDGRFDGSKRNEPERNGFTWYKLNEVSFPAENSSVFAIADDADAGDEARGRHIWDIDGAIGCNSHRLIEDGRGAFFIEDVIEHRRDFVAGEGAYGVYGQQEEGHECQRKDEAQSESSAELSTKGLDWAMRHQLIPSQSLTPALYIGDFAVGIHLDGQIASGLHLAIWSQSDAPAAFARFVDFEEHVFKLISEFLGFRNGDGRGMARVMNEFHADFCFRGGSRVSHLSVVRLNGVNLAGGVVRLSRACHGRQGQERDEQHRFSNAYWRF